MVIWLPILKAARERSRRGIEEAYKLEKLRAVRQCYPALDELSYTEISALYDVDAAYDDIGRG